MVKDVKRKIFLYLNNSNKSRYLVKVLQCINFLLFHWKQRRIKKIKNNASEAKTFFVIRPRGKNEGLISSYFYVLEAASWARKKGYIPFVDFTSEECQYHVEKEIQGTSNAWEYFFEQPYLTEYIQGDRNVNYIYSGWGMDSFPFSFDKFSDVDGEDINNTHNNIYLKKNVQNLIDIAYNDLFAEKNVLGVFIRGTDYVALKPSGHNIQPELSDVIAKIREYISRYKVDMIYLVTEDYNYYQSFIEIFKDKICVYGDSFAKNYKDDDYVSESYSDDHYERNLNYLIRLHLLSKCDYLISSIANGSQYTNMIRNNNKKKYDYWFDLGLYP